MAVSTTLGRCLVLFLLPFHVAVYAAPAALPQPQPQVQGQGVSISLMQRRRPTQLSEEDWSAWAKSNTEGLRSKYTTSGSAAAKKKRASGTNAIVNQGADSSFFGTITIGNPPVPYNVILDTGSSDLWIAGSGCTTCGTTPTLSLSSKRRRQFRHQSTQSNPASSSLKNLNQPFSITYGSGAASGTLVSDSVAMAGFSVVDQVFAVCDDVSDGLLNDPVSGLMGLAWETISSSGATPFWQTLAGAKDAVWDEPLMAFQLTRFNQDPKARSEEVGGSFNLGE
ncbi:hypothetical protein D9758_017738 [Tetrapyrgos nigripes]|uniref:Peptidase A1 domain-containing protein n=1 Tax=Tetrapyrgos nigripes TaxID=182062 RepID=A0A8H5F5Y5_9AGAR|nr:hypothetical protein D9758_017738 [Tetrapyrgos nigripes]